MMGDKPAVLLAYGLVGLGLAAALPMVYRKRMFEQRVLADGIGDEEPIWISLIFGSLTLVLLVALRDALPWRYVLYSAILSALAAKFGSGGFLRSAPAVFLGLLVASVLPWWLHEEDGRLLLGGWRLILIFFVTFATYWMLSREGGLAEDSPLAKRLRLLIYTCFGIATTYLVLTTGLSLTSANSLQWHHWGAYIGPAQLVAAGAHPLHDIPLQYGLGPTLILAEGCQIDCWTSLYWTAGLSTILMTILVGYLALLFNRSKHPLSVLVTLAIVLACCLLWTAFPASLMSSIAFPSASGLRFLPGVLVLTLLMTHARRAGDDGAAKRPPAWGHLVWIACVLWSPEAGVQATTLWAPYFVWTRTLSQPTEGISSRFARAVAELVLALAAGLSLFAVIYRALLGDWPLAGEYVTYLLHPPGPLPINPRGTIWFAVACVACWILGFSVARREDSNGVGARSTWLVALLCFSAFTYYLGRSHDNNILNLLPYFGLLLFAARAVTKAGAIRTVTTTLLASLLGWVSLFGPIHVKAALLGGRLLSFSPQELTRSFNRETEQGLFYLRPAAADQKLHPEDAVPALQYIRSNFHESVEVLDEFLLVDGGEVYPPWNALHGPENFGYIPSAARRSYLERVARRFHRAGWLLYDRTVDAAESLSDYDSVYRRTNELDFGTYRAVRFTPR